MLIKDHEAYLPPATNCTLWRYMDFTKLVSLLETRELYFTRADNFEDPYEGVLPRMTVEAIRSQKEIGPEGSKSALEGIAAMRKSFFVNCWCANDHESAAMWRLFLKSDEGVAIRTTHSALASVLEQSSLSVGTTMVRYVDYDRDVIPATNLFYMIGHKRLSFSHESELRAIIWSFEDVNKTQIPADATSVTVDIAPEELISAVHVSPFAPSWFGQLVEQILHRYGLTVPVERSSLYDRPAY